MYDHEPKAYVCPLCQIAAGQPTDRGSQGQDVILRNALVTAFVAGKWWKSNPGHVIVIPNEHFENLYDLPTSVGHAIFDISKTVAIALKEAYVCDGVSTRQHNEPAGDQDVWHFHLHIFPRYKGDDFYVHHKETFWPPAEERLPYAEKLREHLS